MTKMTPSLSIGFIPSDLYNNIDSLAIFKDGFIFGINNDLFNCK